MCERQKARSSICSAKRGDRVLRSGESTSWRGKAKSRPCFLGDSTDRNCELAPSGFGHQNPATIDIELQVLDSILSMDQSESEQHDADSDESSPSRQQSAGRPSFEDACKFWEAAALEVAVADQRILDLICKKLSEENAQFRSSVIDDACRILGKFNRSPSLELLQEALKCFGEPATPRSDE